MNNLIQNLQSQLDKIKGRVQTTGKTQNNNHTVSLVHMDNMTGNNFAGNNTTTYKTHNNVTCLHTAFSILDNLEPSSWVIDTGGNHPHV